MTTSRSNRDSAAIQTLNGWIDYAHETGKRDKWRALWKAREVIEGELRYDRAKVEAALAFVRDFCKPTAKGRREIIEALEARLEEVGKS